MHEDIAVYDRFPISVNNQLLMSEMLLTELYKQLIGKKDKIYRLIQIERQ